MVLSVAEISQCSRNNAVLATFVSPCQLALRWLADVESEPHSSLGGGLNSELVEVLNLAASTLAPYPIHSLHHRPFTIRFNVSRFVHIPPNPRRLVVGGFILRTLSHTPWSWVT